MKELTRVRQYFEKIKKAEEPPAERTQSVDTQAAIRFIKADLVRSPCLSLFFLPSFFLLPSQFTLTNLQADNQDINTKLKEQLAKERAKAAIRAARGDKGKKRPAEDAGASLAENPQSVSVADSSAAGSSAEEAAAQEPEAKKPKKSKGGKDKGDKKSKKDKKKK